MGFPALKLDLWIERERRPAPLNLSDTEILDWLNEYCDQATYTRPTRQRSGGFTIRSDDIEATAPTLREAVCRVAALFQEANQ